VCAFGTLDIKVWGCAGRVEGRAVIGVVSSLYNHWGGRLTLIPPELPGGSPWSIPGLTCE